METRAQDMGELWQWKLTEKAHRAAARRHMAAARAIAAEWDWGTLPAQAAIAHTVHGSEASRLAKLANEAGA